MVLSTEDKEIIFRTALKEYLKRGYKLEELENFAKRELPNAAKEIKGIIKKNTNASYSTDLIEYAIRQAIGEALDETKKAL